MPFEFDDYVLDEQRRELTLCGKAVAIGPQVFDLLLQLVSHRDQVLGRDELLARVWNGKIVSESTITNNGLDHSDKIHMVERYRLGADGKSLIAIQWFEDPEVLDNKGARFIHWRSEPGSHVFPYDCDPSIATEYQALGTDAAAP